MDAYLRTVAKRRHLSIAHVSRGHRRWEVEEKLQAGKTFDIYYGAGAMDVCQFTPQRPCTYFTIVRDPINRILSDYNYYCILGREGRKHWRFGWRKCSASILDWARYDRNNIITMHLANDMTTKIGPKGYCPGRQFAEVAKQNLRHFSVIILLDETGLDVGLRLLQATYGSSFFVPHHTPKFNTHEKKQLTRDKLTAVELRTLEILLANDLEVYNYARQLHFEQLKRFNISYSHLFQTSKAG